METAFESPMKISYREIESILEMAAMAPSGDNCQPWRFTWNENTLAVFYDKELGEHALNNNDHAALLTLGCLLESIVISASAFKIQVTPSLVAESQFWSERPAVLIQCQRTEITTDPLISEIPRRRTQRAPFSQEKVSAAVVQMMQIEAKRFPLCQLSINQKDPDILFDYVYFCDGFMWRNKQVARDFLAWTRLDDSEIQKHQDGMPWTTLGIKKSETLPLKLFRRFPNLISIFWTLGFSHQIKKLTKSLLFSQGGLYAIAIQNNDSKSLIETGRLAYRLWLLLSQEGYSVQPMSIPSLTGFDVHWGKPPPKTKEAALKKFRNGYQTLQNFFGFAEDRHPVWMFRAGRLKGHQIPSENPTPRLPIHERLRAYTRNL